MTRLSEQISINKNTESLVDDLLKNEIYYGVRVFKHLTGSLIIDSGIEVDGSIEAGLKISEICMGGLGRININSKNFTEKINWCIDVFSSHPGLSCLGSQYAGWSLKHENFFSLGSGPARSLAQKEEIFKILAYSDKAKKTVIVLEVNKIPPNEIIEKICVDCKIIPSNLCVILTPTTSMAGNIQIVARVLEVALHKAHELKFPINKIVNGFGTAPLPPLASDTMTGMGRTNDAIIYGGTIFLTIDALESDLEDLANRLPSSNSKDYGKPFKEIFEEYKGDFYKIDGSLFSPAQVVINSKQNGKTFMKGKINKKLVEKSFFDD